jgi:hypothetical protein
MFVFGLVWGIAIANVKWPIGTSLTCQIYGKGHLEITEKIKSGFLSL